MTGSESDGSDRPGGPPTEGVSEGKTAVSRPVDATGTGEANAPIAGRPDPDRPALRPGAGALTEPVSAVTAARVDEESNWADGSQTAGPSPAAGRRDPKPPRAEWDGSSPEAAARARSADRSTRAEDADLSAGLRDPWRTSPGARRPPAPRALFLARDRYRQRRLRDIARMMPALAALLWLIPLLWRSSDGLPGNGTAFTSVFLFVAWAGLIVGAALIARRIEIEDLDTAPPPKTEPDDRSGTRGAP